MRKIIYTIVAIALIVWAGFTLAGNKAKQEAETAIVAQKNISVAVRIDTVKTEIVKTDYRANGNFIPLQDLKLSSERGGQVVKVLVHEGAKVSIGQTLAVIKPDLYSVELETAEAAYQTAQKDAERFESAFQTGGVTQQQLDQARLQLQSAKARFNQAKINLGDTYVKATINGVVNKKHIEPGTVVGPGTPLFDIVNVSKLKLKVNASENQVATIRTGDQVAIKAGVYPDKEFKGKVVFVAAMADESLNFPVEVEVLNNNDDIRAGMYGSVIFSSKEENKTPVTTISRNAFVGSVSNNEVFVATDGIARLTKIVTGRNFGDKVEVLEGLKAGDIVITSGIINLEDGAKINIVK
ncbi:MAG TPA: efflux RND transporter periplasmic adaptor subunit [Aquaticitalea sp.]|nr:efflux RND transporter periplasmic adaptor subunit [Aquaticitalea sp.]HNU58976.1 efflux RND transporter periplasmic adaptor subunit [Aquaticitalea sp.]